MALFNEITSLARGSLLICIALLFVRFFYRVALHPLRKYPGPFLAKITGGHGWYHAVLKEPHIDVYKNIQKYGPVYRYGPNRLIFNSLSAIQDIYHNPDVIKGPAYHNIRWHETYNVFDTPDKSEHRRKRQVIGRALSDRHLRNFEPIMLDHINTFLGIVLKSAQESKTVDMTPTLKRLAMDVIAYLSFGYALNTQTESTNSFLPDLMNGSIFMLRPAASDFLW